MEDVGTVLLPHRVECSESDNRAMLGAWFGAAPAVKLDEIKRVSISKKFRVRNTMGRLDFRVVWACCRAILRRCNYHHIDVVSNRDIGSAARISGDGRRLIGWKQHGFEQRQFWRLAGIRLTAKPKSNCPNIVDPKILCKTPEHPNRYVWFIRALENLKMSTLLGVNRTRLFPTRQTSVQ